jgi:hypothetical protein
MRQACDPRGQKVSESKSESKNHQKHGSAGGEVSDTRRANGKKQGAEKGSEERALPKRIKNCPADGVGKRRGDKMFEEVHL